MKKENVLPKLNWKLLSKKRGSSTQGLPPAECDETARREWLRALDKIVALHPRAVVAGHGVLDPDSSPRLIEETRGYIRDFDAAVASTSTVLDLCEKMLTLHPNRVNPGSLSATGKAVKGNAQASAWEVKNEIYI